MKDSPEIPMARREYAPSQPTPQKYALRRGLILGLVLGAVVLAGGSWLLVSQPKANAGPPLDVAENPVAVEPVESPVTVPSPGGLLSHSLFPEAPKSELLPVNRGGQKVVYMRKAAARQFLLMQTSAARDGIKLVPLSGFRDIAYQTNLFNRNVARLGGVQQARKVSAPPGYSEHHTGYALDLGDGNAPQTAIEPSFEKTRAFRWLKNNAVRYGFEISFDRGNAQEVNYEPWHWRFIGSKEALETFYGSKTP